MSKKTFTKRSLINGPIADVFKWHQHPDAFRRLTPPWHKIEILEKADGIKDGARVTMLIYAHGMKVKWSLQHTGFIENKQFCDYQVSGPLKSWFHRHLFEPAGDHATSLEDRVEYELPFGFFGSVAEPIAEKELKRLFDYRHQVLQKDFQARTANASASEQH